MKNIKVGTCFDHKSDRDQQISKLDTKMSSYLPNLCEMKVFSTKLLLRQTHFQTREIETNRNEKIVNTGALKTSGLVDMGDDTCSRSRGFESRDHMLNGHFSHI